MGRESLRRSCRVSLFLGPGTQNYAVRARRVIERVRVAVAAGLVPVALGTDTIRTGDGVAHPAAGCILGRRGFAPCRRRGRLVKRRSTSRRIDRC